MASSERLPIQRNLEKTRIAPDLLRNLFTGDGTPTPGDGLHDVIVEMNSQFPGGGKVAQHEFINAFRRDGQAISPPLRDYRPEGLAEAPTTELATDERVSVSKSVLTDGYVFATLRRDTLTKLVALTPKGVDGPLFVYKIWLDHPIKRCVYTSVRTVKSDAARAAFAAAGKNIVWAVADTGIDGSHPHFATHRTLEQLPGGVFHVDFTTDHDNNVGASAAAALQDDAGHGTHVAGIIAGETKPDPGVLPGGIWISRSERQDDGRSGSERVEFAEAISGLAPLCKLVSLKVLAAETDGRLSNLIAAISFVRRVNDYGRTVKIHGINMSLGYTFEPIWFAAGQSPLCNEVDLLVRSGVVVIAAAGNGGYGTVTTYSGTDEAATHLGTINDPGNAELAITVGSTHREWPHNYGVSYFSGKGPTSDGRMKPDLVAPGERIVSCSIEKTIDPRGASASFREDSGTSMAAPHVSGAAAAFMSVRTEFIGRPQQVKDVLMGAATDLKRRPEFQGAGLVDVMRALQAV